MIDTNFQKISKTHKNSDRVYKKFGSVLKNCIVHNYLHHKDTLIPKYQEKPSTRSLTAVYWLGHTAFLSILSVTVTITVTVSAPGVRVQNATVNKDAGGAGMEKKKQEGYF